jgi:hypothetical protein
MSILRWKNKVMLADGGVLRDSGGGGGGAPAAQPTTSTAYNTNVPEYAKPYVENMLQSAQKQIYNDDMTSFRPYTPYSSDVNNYFAGYSPMQKAAQSETANLQTPGELGIAGAGSLLAGNQYARNVTDPSMMAAYMNPYQQGVTDVAKNAATREAMMAENANKLSSARQGTYGGARQALGSIERERNLLSNLSNIQAQGSNQAYNQALQSQQFGANLGLQGYNQAAQIGGQRQAADLARINAQNTMGAGMQNFEQQKVNQGIQNYATAQQYPFMQLGIMNSMLRGLPLQQTTTSTYQQQPSTAQQLTGLGGAALSYMGGGRKEGGIIGMKEGGTVPGFKYGDLISDPQLQGMSQGLSPDQIQGRIADPQVTPNERGIFQGTQQAQQRMASNPMAAQQMAQAAPPPQMAQAPSEDARMGGIAQAGGDMFNTMGYAGGGIIAFEGGGDVPFSVLDEEGNVMPLTTAQKKERDAEKKASTKTAFRGEAKDAGMPTNTREGMYAQTQEMMRKQGFEPGATAEEKALSELYAKHQAGSKEVTSAQERANMALAFLKAGKNPRGFLPGAIEGAESYITGAGEIATKAEARETALTEARAKFAAGQRARAAGDIAASDKLFHEAAQLENQAKIAAGNNAATLGAANIHAAVAGQSTKLEKDAIDAYMKEGLTYTQAYEKVKQAARGDSNDIMRMRYADAALADDPQYLKYKNSKKPEDQVKAKEIKDAKYREYGILPPAAAAANPSGGGAKGQVDTKNPLLGG